jgi:glucose-1-phosphate thymidylyltransferase
MEKIGLIPAAGMGSRLNLPFSKELFPMPLNTDYIPVILNNIIALKKIEVSNIVIVINHNKSDIMRYLGNGRRFGVSISYVVQESPVSLPHALAEAANLIDNKEVFFLMGDTIISKDDFLLDFVSKIDYSFDISLGCFYTDNPGKFATVRLESGIVKFCEEKNPMSSNELMWGFWRWTPSFTKQLVRKTKSFKVDSKEQTLSELIFDEISKNQVQGIILHKHKYWDFGTFDEINKYIDYCYKKI